MWLNEVKRYDMSGMRKHLGYSVNGVVKALGLSHQKVWYRHWVEKNSLGKCVDLVVGLGGNLVSDDLFEVVIDGKRVYGRFSDFEIET